MNTLSPAEQDALREMMNIAAGRAADAMARLFNIHIGIRVAEARVIEADTLLQYLRDEMGVIGSLVTQAFWGDLRGTAMLVLPREQTLALMQLLLYDKKQIPHISIEDESALAEVGNILLSACISTFVQQLNLRARFQLPRVILNLDVAQFDAYIKLDMRQQPYQIVLLSSYFDFGDQQLEAYIAIALTLEMNDLLQALRAVLPPA
ncbi:MAG: hypothetical protein Fur0018_00140 [Anaerolineales bacterium]